MALKRKEDNFPVPCFTMWCKNISYVIWQNVIFRSLLFQWHLCRNRLGSCMSKLQQVAHVNFLRHDMLISALRCRITRRTEKWEHRSSSSLVATLYERYNIVVLAAAIKQKLIWSTVTTSFIPTLRICRTTIARSLYCFALCIRPKILLAVTAKLSGWN